MPEPFTRGDAVRITDTDPDLGGLTATFCQYLDPDEAVVGIDLDAAFERGAFHRCDAGGGVVVLRAALDPPDPDDEAEAELCGACGQFDPPGAHDCDLDPANDLDSDPDPRIDMSDPVQAAAQRLHDHSRSTR